MKKKQDHIKTGYYIANEVNGVWFEGDAIDDPTTELMSVTEFYNRLPTATSNIACFFDAGFVDEDVDIMKKIKKEYGINN